MPLSHNTYFPCSGQRRRLSIQVEASQFLHEVRFASVAREAGLSLPRHFAIFHIGSDYRPNVLGLGRSPQSGTLFATPKMSARQLPLAALLILLLLASGLAQASPVPAENASDTAIATTAPTDQTSGSMPQLGTRAPVTTTHTRTNGSSAKPKTSAQLISSTEAARIARDKVSGRVLNVVLAHGTNGPYYLVKILTQGRIQIVRVSATK